MVTGGAGYVGARLVPRLALRRGTASTVLDLYMFGDDVLDEVQEPPPICVRSRGDLRDISRP